MKYRTLKFLISMVFILACRLRDSIRFLLGIERSGTFVVLCYHVITDCMRPAFAKQMAEVVRIAIPVDLGYSGPFEAGRHYVAITFDDGLQSVLENAVPEMEKRNIPATFFVPTGYFGRTPDWTPDKTDEIHHEVVMTDSQVKALGTMPGMTIGSHLVTHPRMSQIDESQAREEMRQSRQALETLLCREILYLAFPYGDYTAESLRWAQDAGYEHAYGVIPSFRNPGRNQFFIGRTCVVCDNSPIEFRLQIQGGFRWLASARDWKHKLFRIIGRAVP